MKKIFINNIGISFGEKPLKDKDTYNIIYHHKSLFEKLYYLCSQADNEDYSFGNIHLVAKDEDECFDDFKAFFPTIHAAGGVVKKKSTQEILMIYRWNMWDLPKGKLEKDEKKKAAAIREVEEECGITGLKIGKKLKKTYHMYELKGQPVLKVTHWYEMSYNGEEIPEPQLEEDIVDVQWCDSEFIYEVIQNQNTYPGIALLLQDILE